VHDANLTRTIHYASIISCLLKQLRRILQWMALRSIYTTEIASTCSIHNSHAYKLPLLLRKMVRKYVVWLLGQENHSLAHSLTLSLSLSHTHTHTHTHISYSKDKLSKKTWTTVLSPMISCIANYITKFILTSLPLRTRLSQTNERTGLYYIINLYQMQRLFNVEWYRIIPFAELERIKRSWTT